MDLLKGLWAAALAAGVSGACLADTVFLADGGEISGTVIEVNGRTVVVRTASGAIRSVRRADVVEIVYDRNRQDKTQLVNPGGEKPAPDAAAPAAPAETKTEPSSTTDAASKTDPAAKTESGAKTGDLSDAEKADPDLAELAAWKAPSGMSQFPRYAKRMPEAQEAKFLEYLEQLSSTDEKVFKDNRDAIQSLGQDVVPYLAFGINHQNIRTRTACMNLLGALGDKGAVKQIIEVTYAAMPEGTNAPPFQRGFIRAAKDTLTAVTGQAFINVEADKLGVHEGLAQYIKWYQGKYEQAYDPADKLIGDPPLPETHAKFATLLKEARALKQERREWVRPPSPEEELTSGNVPKNNDRPNVPQGLSGTRPEDKNYLKTIPKVERDALDRKRY